MAISKETQDSIKQGYQPSEEEKKVLRWVYERAQNMNNQERQKLEKEWEEAEEQWEADVKEKKDWKSNIIPPMTTAIIEAELAQLVDYNPTPYLIGRTSEDNNVAKAYSYILDYTKDVGKFKIELFTVLKELLIKGTAIAQEYVWQDVRTVKELVQYDPEKGIEKYEEKEIELFNMPYMEAVPLEEMYFDETCSSLRGPRGAKDCIRRQVKHIEEFRKIYKGPINDPLGNAKFVLAGAKSDECKYLKEPSGAEGQMVEILHYWGITPYDAYWIVANGVVIRKDPNPYQHKQLPFGRAIDVLRTHRFYGKGECKLLKSIQDELSTLRRMRIDRQHLQIDKMFALSSRETDIDEEDLMVRPHGIIKLEDPKSLQPIEYSDVHSSAYLEEDRLKEDAIRITGIDDRMQSTASSVARTATEAAILKESTLQRLRTKLFLLEAGFLADIGELRLANINQFMARSVVKRILGKDAADLELQIQKAKEENSYLDVDGKPFKKEFRKIPTLNKTLKRTTTGKIIEEPYDGIGFFTLTPDVVSAKFDIRYGGGPDLPVSKTLEAQRFTDVYDRLIRNPAFDPQRLGDELLRVNGKEPKDFSAAPQEEQMAAGQDILQNSFELASQENEEMMNGSALPPTPYATEDHTNIHVTFMESDNFKQAPNEIITLFTEHITGEYVAQQKRGKVSTGEGLPTVGGMQPQQGTNEMNNEMRGMMPNKTQGNENVEVINPPQKNG